MLLSIKSLAALSLLPLSIASAVDGKAGHCDNCNFASPYNRVQSEDASSSIRGSDVPGLNVPQDACPIIAGRNGTAVCVLRTDGSSTPKLLAQNNHCPNLSPASQLVANTDIYSCVAYYQTFPPLDFDCPTGDYIQACRYCAIPDYAPELSRDFIYTRSATFSGIELSTAVAEPFKCGAPKCPRFAPITTNGAPVKFARLAAAYCSTEESTDTVPSPYDGLLGDYDCRGGLVQAAVSQKFGCYLREDLAAELGKFPSDWCSDSSLTPYCFYEVPKPFSYPILI